MILYSIRNWATLFENNRTRELKRLDWVPLPNKQDGDGYTMIMEMKNGPAIFGTWVALLQVASRGSHPIGRCGNPAPCCDCRGTLLRDGGKPHDFVSLSRITRIPQQLVKEALDFLSSTDVNWLETADLPIPCDNPAPPRDNPAGECLEGKGRELKGRELKGMEVPVAPPVNKSKGTLDEVKAYCKEIGLPESDGQWFFDRCEGCGWKNGSNPIKDWKATVRAWTTAGYMASQKGKYGNNNKNTSLNPAADRRNAGTIGSTDWGEVERRNQQAAKREAEKLAPGQAGNETQPPTA